MRSIGRKDHIIKRVRVERNGGRTPTCCLDVYCYPEKVVDAPPRKAIRRRRGYIYLRCFLFGAAVDNVVDFFGTGVEMFRLFSWSVVEGNKENDRLALLYASYKDPCLPLQPCFGEKTVSRPCLCAVYSLMSKGPRSLTRR